MLVGNSVPCTFAIVEVKFALRGVVLTILIVVLLLVVRSKNEYDNSNQVLVTYSGFSTEVFLKLA